MPVVDDPRDRRGPRPSQRPQRPAGPQGPQGAHGPGGPFRPQAPGQAPRPQGLQGQPISGLAGASQASDPALSSLSSRFSGLSGRISLGNLLDQLEDMNGRIGSLGPNLANLRARGYRFGRGWEEQVQALAARWSTQHADARRLLDDQVASLRAAAQSAEQALQRAQRDATWLNTAERQIGQLEQQLSSAEQVVRGAFDQTESEVSALTKAFSQVALLHETLDTAKIELYPDECGVAVCKAQWLDKGAQPEGVLVLTDGRLILEQKEKKVTKKLLFFTASSETVHKLLFESAVGNIAELEASDTGGVLGIGSKELLNVRFSKPPENMPASITLRLMDGARNEDWAALIKRVQSGQIEAERYVAASAQATAAPAATQTPVNIPSDCPACGAKLPAYVKGMRQLECEYCGKQVSLF